MRPTEIIKQSGLWQSIMTSSPMQAITNPFRERQKAEYQRRYKKGQLNKATNRRQELLEKSTIQTVWTDDKGKKHIYSLADWETNPEVKKTYEASRSKDMKKVSVAFPTVQEAQQAYRTQGAWRKKKKPEEMPFGFPTVAESRKMAKQWKRQNAPKPVRKREATATQRPTGPIIFSEKVKREQTLAGGGTPKKTGEQVLNEWNVAQGRTAPFQTEPAAVASAPYEADPRGAASRTSSRRDAPWGRPSAEPAFARATYRAQRPKLEDPYAKKEPKPIIHKTSALGLIRKKGR